MDAITPLEKRPVGFAGLGAMGLGMATNMLKAGFKVHGFDVFPSALDNFTAAGGQASSTIQEASQNQRHFFVMVATPEQVDALVFGDAGLSTALPDSSILVLFSTLPPNYVTDLVSRLAACGRDDIRLVDCPVSGGVVGATAGQLSIMMGSDDATIAEIRPELEAVSAPGRLFKTGPLGSASTIKMLNQHLAGTHIVAAAEALAFAKALGLSSRDSYRVLMSSEAASWIMGDRGLSMLKADWSTKSAVGIFIKDLGIVSESADDLCLACPIASTALQAFIERAARGFRRDDDSSVVCNYEGITGAKVAELENDISIISPAASPLGERSQIVLVPRNKDCACCLEEAVLGGKEKKVQILIEEADFSGLPEGTLVGVSEAQPNTDLGVKHPHLQFFDYQIVSSQDFKTQQIIYTNLETGLQSSLADALAHKFSIVPIEGVFGSATSMYMAVQMAALVHVTAAAECYSLALARGVSVDLVYSLISGAAGSSAQFNAVFPEMIRKDEETRSLGRHSSVDKALQDLDMIKAAAKQICFPLRMVDAAHHIFKKVRRDLAEEELPVSSLVTFWERSVSLSQTNPKL